MTLPHTCTPAHYWDVLYHQPVAFWQPVLDAITAQHALLADQWTRAALGRNVVFVGNELVIKLGPPCWPGEMAREAAALQHVAGRLPVATPTLRAHGSIEQWGYLVQERLPGTNLRSIWAQLDPNTQTTLAYQHGTLMAALHALPLGANTPLLHHDWQAMLAEQYATCAIEMGKAGVDPVLVNQVESYLAATPWPADDDQQVLLHGDLAHVNFLVAQQAGIWRITSIIDWGDAKIGPRTHELISPGVHMYMGDAAALTQWYAGYGWNAAARTAERQHITMARAMLYYAEDMPGLLQRVRGAATCRNWQAMAAAFWHFAG